MPAPITFSDAPYERRWYEPLLPPLVLLGNLGVAALAYPGVSSARIRWEPELGPLLELVRSRTRPIIFYSWHAYELAVLCVVFRLPEDARPVGIGHDGLPSRLLQQAAAWLGVPVWVYRRRSLVRPGQQLIDFMRHAPVPPLMGLFTDAGGPYGRAKEGLLTVAQATGALVVPVAPRCRPALMLPIPVPYTVPLPFARIDVHHGPPLDAATASLKDMDDALRAVDSMAHGVWERRRPADPLAPPTRWGP